MVSSLYQTPHDYYQKGNLMVDFGNAGALTKPSRRGYKNYAVPYGPNAVADIGNAYLITLIL
jgi:hypothetical protein